MSASNDKYEEFVNSFDELLLSREDADADTEVAGGILSLAKHLEHAFGANFHGAVARGKSADLSVEKDKKGYTAKKRKRPKG